MLAGVVVIGEPLGARQPRVEILGIEIAIVDRVALGGKPLDDRSGAAPALKLVSTGWA